MRYLNLEDYLNQLNEAKASTSLTKEQIFEAIKKDCKNYSPDNTPLYRGRTKVEDGFYVDSSSWGDASDTAHNQNYINLFFDNSFNWKQFPKRNRSSFFSSNDYKEALKYANGNKDSVYIVIPKDGVRMGICPEEDFFDGFDSNLGQVFDGRVNEFFDKFLAIAYNKLTGKVLDEGNYDKFLEELEIFDKKNLRKTKWKTLLKGNKKALETLEEFMADDIPDFIVWMEESLFQPKANKFTFKPYKKGFAVNGTKEVWTDQPFYMLSMKYEKELKELFKK